MGSRYPSARPTKRTGRIVWVLTGLFVGGLLVNWWFLAHDDPSVVLPHPVLPSPNGYDFYVAAGNAMRPTRPITGATMENPFVGARTTAQEKDLERVEAAVQQNASTIQALRRGFAYDYRAPPTPPLASSFREIAYFRDLARVLFAQSRVCAARGDWSGAAESALDAIQLGEEIQHGGILIESLTGCTCQTIGQRPLWNAIGHLNAAQSRAAALRLQGIMERQFPYSDTIQEEKWNGQATLLLLFRGITLRNALSTADSFGADGQRQRTTAQRYQDALSLLYGKRRMMRDYTAYMDRISQVSRQSYGRHLPLPPLPTDPYNRILLAVYKNARLHDAGTETQNGLLLTALALHAFQCETGHYPKALTELTPSYLKQLFEDPFAVQGPFKYTIQGKNYTLYSVGPDGEDNAGTPIDAPQYVEDAHIKQRYRITAKTRGDIVAGVNIP